MFFNHPETSPLNADAPLVYLLGLNDKSLFLTARLQDAGANTVILTSPNQISELAAKELVVKEDRLLQRKKHSLHTDFALRHDFDLLIITSSSSSLKSDLTLLSPAKLQNALILNLSLLETPSLLTDIIRTPVVNGYLQCFVEYDPKPQLNILGRNQSLTVSCTDEHPLAAFLSHWLRPDDTEIIASPDDNYNFWYYFIPYAAAALISSSLNKPIYTIAKDEQGRKSIDSCLKELLAIASAHKVTINHADMLKKIYNIPADYIFPLQRDTRNGTFSELNTISSLLLQNSDFKNFKISVLRGIFKQIYDKTLA